MKNIIGALFFIFLLIPAATCAQDGFVLDGKAWQKLNRESKIFYLAGYLKGANRGMLIGLQDVDCISHKELASKAQNKYRNFVGKGNMQTLFNEIERVYQNKKNLVIEVDEVIVFALKKAQGNMSSQKQETWLDLLRTMNQ